MNAVEVRNVTKYYGSAKKPSVILNKFNMSIRHGSIYALMGASGCGKTTLLSCIVGLITFDSGTINVLQESPTVVGSKIRHKIGYMPQEIALIDKFTIKEILYYFGSIYGMSHEQIKDQYEKLKSLLDLPRGDSLIHQCSGGEQRRISFAVSMIHKPELLILDEPTVGLDCILREKVWSFLVKEKETRKLTVVMTTHYMQEAQLGDCVGLMRNGMLIAEDLPQNLIDKSGSLEQAFLELCLNDNGISGSSELHENITDKIDKVPLRDDKKDGQLLTVSFSQKRFKALLKKNFIQMSREPTIIFLMIIPIVLLSFFYLAIGGNPKGTILGIVNDELSSPEECFNSTLISSSNADHVCDLKRISCRFLQHINESIASQVFYDNFHDAYVDARATKIFGILHFESNYTESYIEVRDSGLKRNGTSATSKKDVELKRSFLKTFLKTEGIDMAALVRENVATVQAGSYDNGKIKIYMDRTNRQQYHYIEAKLYEIYREFSESLMADCGIPIKLANFPLDIQTYYGSFDNEFKDSMAPGMIMAFIFALGALVSSNCFVKDRLEGIWNRILLAGVTIPELLCSSIISHSTIVFVQCLGFLITSEFIFNKPIQGNYSLVFLLTFLLGFTGMIMGLLISICSTTYTNANALLTGVSSPIFWMLCGALWPLESLPTGMRYFSYMLPFTLPAISMRNIIAKGYSIGHPTVLAGFGVASIWIVFSVVCCLIVLRFKKFSKHM